MTKQQHKAALERAIEHWNSGDLPGYLDMYDPDTVLHGLPGVEPGLESIKRFYDRFWAAFPGCQITLHSIVSEGDEVGCRFVLDATHQGDFMGHISYGQASDFDGSYNSPLRWREVRGALEPSRLPGHTAAARHLTRSRQPIRDNEQRRDSGRK